MIAVENPRENECEEGSPKPFFICYKNYLSIEKKRLQLHNDFSF